MLSLLRVESLSVEGMMSRSFREADHQRKMDDIRTELEILEIRLKRECDYVLSDYLEPLIKFYKKARKYIEYRENFLVRKLDLCFYNIKNLIIITISSNYKKILNFLIKYLFSNTISLKIQRTESN